MNISNLISSTCPNSVTGQTNAILASLRAILSAHALTPDSLVFTTILLRSMSSFPLINALYGALFTRPIPPARATIACGDILPPGCEIMLSATAALSTDEPRTGLHVQSRSYWAPANIGPYSQAVSLRNPPISVGPGEDAEPVSSQTVFVAGQIPLVPATMEPFGPEAHPGEDGAIDCAFADQALLSLQHLWRIGAATNVSWWTGAVAFLAPSSSSSSSSCHSTDLSHHADAASKIWSTIHADPSDEPDPSSSPSDSDSGPDIWDRTHGASRSFTTAEQPRPGIPDWARLDQEKRGYMPQPGDCVPGFFAVEVEGLPRGVEVEWVSQGVGFGSEGGGSGGGGGGRGKVHVNRSAAGLGMVSGVKSRVSGGGGVQVWYAGFGEVEHAVMFLRAKGLWAERPTDGESVRREGRSSAGGEGTREEGAVEEVGKVAWSAVLYTAHPGRLAYAAAQIVPCRRVWGDGGMELAVGIVLSG